VCSLGRETEENVEAEKEEPLRDGDRRKC